MTKLNEAMKGFNESISKLDAEIAKSLVDYLKREDVNLALVLGLLDMKKDAIKHIMAMTENAMEFKKHFEKPSYVG